jgi:dienelactone hydrolase
MRGHRLTAVGIALALSVSWPAASPGQTPGAYEPPSDIAYRKATVVSEGSRLAAELFSPKAADKPLPTIVMSHGWGGTAQQLRADAVVFARAGYLIVTFDYRGWGASEGRVVLTKPATRGKPGEPFTAEVKEIREVVDPLEQTTDLLNVLHWLQGEKQCDRDRIGLWGSSYSGGHVVYAAARDPRVKATVSQVPALDSRFVLKDETLRKQTFDQATQRARGEIGYPPPGQRVIGNLAHERAKGPRKLVILPGLTHYDIYLKARKEAQKLALEWFDKYLKQ